MYLDALIIGRSWNLSYLCDHASSSFRTTSITDGGTGVPNARTSFLVGPIFSYSLNSEVITCALPSGGAPYIEYG
eukprot:scaffold50871_cov63-Attheya_sp.AAC.1